MGDEAGDDYPKKRAGSNAAITAQTLKKAKKTKALLAEKNKSEEASNTGQRSMFEFTRRGASSAAAASTNTSLKKNAARTVGDLDSLIDGLDTVAAPAAKKRRPNRSYGRAASSNRPRGRTGRATMARRSLIHRREPTYSEEQDEYAPGFHDDNDDNDFVDWDNDDAGAVETQPTETNKESTTKEESTHTEDDTKQESSKDADGDVEMEDASSNDKDAADDTDNVSNKPVQRKRFARTKLGRMSAPAKEAMEKAQQKPFEQTTKLATSAPSNVDTSSASFKPDNIAVESTDAAAAANNAATLESVLQEGTRWWTVSRHVLDGCCRTQR